MSDLLSTVYRCDLCAHKKEQREFAFITDETNHISVWRYCGFKKINFQTDPLP